MLIKVIAEGHPITIQNGIKTIPVKWVEVSSINLGSIKKPNNEVLEIVIEPVKYEQEYGN